MEIRRITKENAEDLKLKNEPFAMPGQFIPALSEGVWTYRTEMYPQCQWMTFPDEDYDFTEMEKTASALARMRTGSAWGWPFIRTIF